MFTTRALLLKQYRACRQFREREQGPERLTRDTALQRLAADIRRLKRG